MIKHIFKYSTLCLVAMLACACNDDENKLLEPKVYFENKEYKLEVVDNQETLTYDLQARVSSMYPSTVNVSYDIADASSIDEYNKKNGTDYEAFDTSNVKLESTTSSIKDGEIYANKVTVELSNLGDIKEGKPYLLPIYIKSSSLPVIKGTDITYIIVNKPVRITKVCSFYSNHIKVPIQPGKPLKSVTYEALIYINRLGNNNTIMGTEGILIFRIGDLALPGGHNDWIQIAGNKQYHSTQAFETKKWYHVAFTYDQMSGKTAIYINGSKAAESTWDTPSFDLSADGGGFFIGKVAGFMWGERPFYGYMSEVRIWNVSRTENQIKQNMLSVDPNSDGLFSYYRLNGADQFESNGKWYIKDESGNDMDGLANGGKFKLNFFELETPIAIK